MAFKVSFHMFVCFLLVAAAQVYAGPPVLLESQCDDHATAPAPSTPAKPAPQIPTQAPTSTPVYFPPHAAPPQTPSSPSSAPTHSTPPIPGASSSRNHLRYCVPQCQLRCIMLRDQHKTLRKIRSCVHVCTACCEKNKPLCVPSPVTTCPIWDTVIYHGGVRQCP